MNNNLTFSYNNKVYKTEAAMKKAKTMDAKRANKQVKKEAYAVSEKKQKREATIDYKKNYKLKLENSIKANENYHQKRFGGIRRFHIVANIEQTLHFDNVYSKKGGYKKDELSDTHKSKVQMIREAQVIEAKNVEIAKQKFLDKVNEKFNDDILLDNFKALNGKDSATNVSRKVENCLFIDVVDENRMIASASSTMFLKLASPMNYTFTTEERKFLKNEGTCVEDNLLGIYSPLIKSFTLESIRKIASNFYDINLLIGLLIWVIHQMLF